MVGQVVPLAGVNCATHGLSRDDTRKMQNVRNRSMVLFSIMCAFLPAALAAQTDVAGDWDVTFESDQGTTLATMTLAQEGERLTGSISTDLGTFEFEGTITGSEVTAVLKLDGDGQVLEIKMDGTVDGDEMTGMAELGGFSSGSWTATRR